MRTTYVCQPYSKKCYRAFTIHLRAVYSLKSKNAQPKKLRAKQKGCRKEGLFKNSYT
jgi:hypothetical protein